MVQRRAGVGHGLGWGEAERPLILAKAHSDADVQAFSR